MKKPVWKVNPGQGVPSDAEGTTFIPDSVEPIFYHSDYLENPSCWIVSDFLSIVAYQTTRTKAAKYEVVECYVCEGAGSLENPKNVFAYIYSVFEKDNKCPHCNGKGYTLERIK